MGLINKDMAKRLLLVGNANHYFNKKLYSLIQKQNRELIIDILNTGLLTNRNDSLPFDSVFENTYHSSKSILTKIRGVKGMYFDYLLQKQFLNLCSKHNYEFVHFQSIALWSHAVIRQIKAKVYITIWGSDFFRIKKKDKSKLLSIIDGADLITVATEEIKQELISTTMEHKDVRVIKFGLEVFDEIDLLSINSDKKLDKQINITVGYNRHPAQQHQLILTTIAAIKNIDFSRINFVLPFTYGPKNEAYRIELEKILKQMSADYIFLDDFMDSKQMAQTCLRSDIMIQLQTTDAFSGSMQEYLYAGNLIITGSWLPYKEMKDRNIYFREITEIDELRTVLPDVLNNLKEQLYLCVNNKKPLYNLSSWSSNFEKWNRLYV